MAPETLPDLLLQTLATPPPFAQSVLILSVVVAVALHLLPRIVRYKRVSQLALRSLRHGGALPGHIAFIMDGNRRWARRLGLAPSRGHPEGGEKLVEALQWCLDANIGTVTVFAFSIENFKRSKAEVDELMALAERTFHRFASQSHVVHERRVRIRFWGDWAFISPKLRAIMRDLVTQTSTYHDGPVLNICFAYAARYDIANAVHHVVSLNDGEHKGDDATENDEGIADYVDEALITSCLSSGVAKDCTNVPCEDNAHQMQPLYEQDQLQVGGFCPDLLVRTSGETRLSDFLLWESAQCMVSFYPALWPDLTMWDFVKILLEYQRNVRRRDTHYASLQRERPRLAHEHTAAISKIAEQHLHSIMEVPVES